MKILDYDPSVFAENGKYLRKEKNIGQNELARLLNLSNSSISYWENCKQEPTISALYKLAQFFEVSIDFLVGFDN